MELGMDEIEGRGGGRWCWGGDVEEMASSVGPEAIVGEPNLEKLHRNQRLWGGGVEEVDFYVVVEAEVEVELRRERGQGGGFGEEGKGGHDGGERSRQWLTGGE